MCHAPVCGPSTYENTTDATSCERCPANSYCTGGDKVENPTSRGALQECGAGLITRNTGARSQTDCVAPAGFAMTSPTTATACGQSEYAPRYNRLKTCLKCQGGLEEEVPSTFTDGQRSSKRAVCSESTLAAVLALCLQNCQGRVLRSLYPCSESACVSSRQG
jgi:hypothetical protein